MKLSKEQIIEKWKPTLLRYNIPEEYWWNVSANLEDNKPVISFTKSKIDE